MFRDKTIVIMGGGPSTNDVYWQNGDHDEVWSVNFGFRHNKVQTKENALSLLFVNSFVKIDHPDLQEYLKKHNTILATSPWHKYDTHPAEVNAFNNIDRDKKIIYYTAHQNDVGQVTRLTILAHFLGVREVRWVGCDGPKYILDGNHAFEPGKSDFNIRHQGLRRDPDMLRQAFIREYKRYFDYMRKRLKTKMRIVNLAKHYPHSILNELEEYFDT